MESALYDKNRVDIFEYVCSLRLFQDEECIYLNLIYKHVCIFTNTGVLCSFDIPVSCTLEEFKKLLGQYVNLPEDE